MVDNDLKSKLAPVLRKPTLKLETDDIVECTIWKIYESEKTYKGESQGMCPTFELTTSGKEVLIIQSKSNSSWAMLDEWSDKKSPMSCICLEGNCWFPRSGNVVLP